MKKQISLVFLISCFSIVVSEEVEVFTSDTESHFIESGEGENEGTKTVLTVYRIGNSLGMIDTGKVSLAQVAVKAAAYDSSADPFFGPGVNYIVKDSSGRHYTVFFEYAEGHRTFNGFRMAINQAKLVDPNKPGLFFGSPYAGGASFDDGILAQLKALTQKKTAEEPGTGQSTNRPELESKDGQKP